MSQRQQEPSLDEEHKQGKPGSLEKEVFWKGGWRPVPAV